MHSMGWPSEYTLRDEYVDTTTNEWAMVGLKKSSWRWFVFKMRHSTVTKAID